MRNILILISTLSIAMMSCKKDEPVDLSYLCTKGDLWLVNRSDSFNPDHNLDTFVFKQGAGYHSFVFTNSYVNRLQIDVLAKPSLGQTIVYKKQFIKSITGSIITQPFTYNNTKDSILSITNNGANYTIDIKTVAVNITPSSTKDLRACGLKMKDTMP
jgi:hypothetical protein